MVGFDGDYDSESLTGHVEVYVNAFEESLNGRPVFTRKVFEKARQQLNSIGDHEHIELYDHEGRLHTIPAEDGVRPELVFCWPWARCILSKVLTARQSQELDSAIPQSPCTCRHQETPRTLSRSRIRWQWRYLWRAETLLSLSGLHFPQGVEFSRKIFEQKDAADRFRIFSALEPKRGTQNAG